MFNKLVQKIIANWLLILLFINFPIFSFFNQEKFVFGFPIALVYLFFVWIWVVVLMYRLIRKSEHQ